MDERLKQLRGKMPGRWEAWTSVTGCLMARRLKTSPPVVLRDMSPEGLLAKVTQYEEARGSK